MSLRAPPEERSAADLLSFGVVNLDKPAGPSAHQVSAWVRDMVADRVGEDAVDKAAHAGTLDPKVTGCLPTMLGDATRLAQVFLEGAKEYVAVLELHDSVPSDIEAVAGEFEGPLYQKPPRKSAVARNLRVREVYDLDVLEATERQALLRIRCESGTYVRKLCHDLGLALGTGAHMGHLRRTATDPFDDRNLATLHDLEDALAFLEDGDEDLLREVVAPAERALDHLPRVTVAPSAAEQIANGAQVYAPGVVEADDAAREEGGLVACYAPNGSAVCLGRTAGPFDADAGVAVELERVLV
ncbi:RNA-guided pseudouridylation complex pseudouridine synthase subunit Cbf5 [Halostella sp. JP-L12]|uniref:RNA-guided pseudouridylation complex pseudouridine synthase subunit Cbf5 n=1 Tax=Halostella TaxID=1843185 RepID=UPI000EF767BB|nr:MULTISPECIES: RNA-guided pseudouridylation complex pseudouridine synthase subunit Cbf5 [Halostella]NHN47200.1 RNA-guided pseudouridylation complex pseudouridine synthase subunit Cbf5 [Halostella sp. JP-L12]